METRSKVRRKKSSLLKNFADQDKRPVRAYLDDVKAMISAGEVETKKHTYWYGDAIKDLNHLKAAFTDLEKLALDAELQRPEYKRDARLWEDYKNLRLQEKVIRKSMADMRSGKTMRDYQDEAARIGIELNRAHRAQADVVKKQNADDLYRRLNEVRVKNKSLIDDAQGVLEQLIDELDALNGCCVPKNKVNAANEKIAKQKLVVNQLVEESEKELQKMMKAETDNTVTTVVTEEIAALQRRYDQARANARHCDTNKDAILAEKQRTLDSIKLDERAAIKKLNDASLHYHANLDTQVMHGIIRLNARFNAFKTAFDQAVHKYIKHKDEATNYQAQLESSKVKLDGLMSQLWCENYRKLDAAEIYQQFTVLPQQFRDKLLAQKPDTTALAQITGEAAAAKLATAKVSAGGIFKSAKPGLTADEKRKQLQSLHTDKRVSFR